MTGGGKPGDGRGSEPEGGGRKDGRGDGGRKAGRAGRDRRGRGRDPRPLAESLTGFRERVAPKTALAGVQGVWAAAVGPGIAAVTEVVAERGGVVTIECSSTVWAQELELMSSRLLVALNRELDGRGPEKLRFRAPA